MSVKCTFSTTDSGTKQEGSVKADKVAHVLHSESGCLREEQEAERGQVSLHQQGLNLGGIFHTSST